jgi:hypothetical protein
MLSKLKKSVVAVAMAGVLAGPLAGGAYADEIYHEFPIGNGGIGMVCQINTDTRTITWMWYDANGNWGYLGTQTY